VTRTYRQIVANHQRQYPHQVKLANAGDWRDRHCSHKAREIMSGPLVQWFEGGLWVYGFKTAEQAAAFKAWSERTAGSSLTLAGGFSATPFLRGMTCTWT